MSQPREPVRWADPASESDPVLRRLLGSARADVGDAALAERIERAVQTHVATTSRSWRPWVGVTALCLTFGGAALGLRSPAPGPRVDPAKSSETSAANSGDIRSASAIAADITEERTTQQLSETSTANSGDIRPASATAEDTTAGRTKQAAASSDSVRSASAAAPPARTSEERARRAIQQPNDPNGARAQERRLDQPARAERGRTNSRAQMPGAAPASELDDVRNTRTNIGAARRHVASRDTENHDGEETYEASAQQPSAAMIGMVSPSMSPDQTAVPPELTLISAAQRALRDSPKEALALTEQHVRAYPNGGFQEEREEIAISALFALGRQTSARTRAQTFLSQHPRALSAPRIQKLLNTSH